MKKMMFGVLSMVAVFALSTGSTPTASAQPEAPSIGGCRWFCGAGTTPFKTAAACRAACSSECEAVC
jgi:hypothetical protein